MGLLLVWSLASCLGRAAGSSLQRSSPHHILVRGDACCSSSSRGLNVQPLSPGSCWGQRACPHHLYKVLSLCASPSFLFVLRNQDRVGPVPSLPILRFSSFRQVTCNLVTYTFKQNLLVPLRQEKSWFLRLKALDCLFKWRSAGKRHYFVVRKLQWKNKTE